MHIFELCALIFSSQLDKQSLRANMAVEPGPAVALRKMWSGKVIMSGKMEENDRNMQAIERRMRK